VLLNSFNWSTSLQPYRISRFRRRDRTGHVAVPDVEEALRVQKLSLVLQSLMMFAMLGTFLIALNKFTNGKK